MKLNVKRTFFVGFAFMSICTFWQVYDNVIPLILKNTFNIGDTLSGFVMAIDNILGLFMLPLFGSISDKTSTKIGKRMPFIICGTAGAVIFMNLISYADNTSNFILFMISLGMVLIFMATYRSPAVALMSDVTPKWNRSRANAIINLMGTFGGIISLLLMMTLISKNGKTNYAPIFLIVSIIMVVAVLILFKTIKENAFVEERERLERENSDFSDLSEEIKATNNIALNKSVRKSLYLILFCVFFFFVGYNAVTTSFSKYSQSYLGQAGGGFAGNLLVATVAATIAYIPIGSIASKIGRKKTIIGGLLLMIISFTAASFYKQIHWTMTLILMMMGIGYAAVIVNTLPMVVEMATGSDIGKYTGTYYTFSMSAQILTPILSGFFLEHVGYQTLFPYAVVALILSLLCMMFVKHGDDSFEAPKNKLEIYDTEE